MQPINSQITDCRWERIHLYLHVKFDDAEKLSDSAYFFLVNSNKRIEAEFKIVERQGSDFVIYLNITNSGINRCVQNGKYSILMLDGEDFFSVPYFNNDTRILDGWCRVFRYHNGRGAYTITFTLEENFDVPKIIIFIRNTTVSKMSIPSMPPMSRIDLGVEIPLRKRLFKFVKKVLKKSFANKIRRKILGKIKKERRKLPHRVYALYRKLYRNSGKYILFLSAQDDTLALNLKYIYNRLVERGLDKQYKILFSLRKVTSKKVSKFSTVREWVYLGMSKTIIIDDHVPLLDRIHLSPETKLIQIWHAGAGFKGVGFCRWGHTGSPSPFNCHRQYTWCISDSKKIAPFFSEQFGILDEQVIPTGMPRMDEFFDEKRKSAIKEDLYKEIPQLKNSKVILFAPTYRGVDKGSAFYPYEKIDFSRLYDYCTKNNTVVLFKMHPFVAEPVPIDEQFKECFFDMSKYPNINDLFFVTDLLITDYSSNMYEYALMNKPMLSFAFDKAQYSMSRGFHRDYDSNVPGKICATFDELMNAMEAKDFEYEKHEDYVRRHFDNPCAGNTDRVIDWLILDNMPQEYKNALEERWNRILSVRGVYVGNIIETNRGDENG